MGGRGERMEVSHLLFPDDTIDFWNSNQEHSENLTWGFRWFEASGLKLNMEKQ